MSTVETPAALTNDKRLSDFMKQVTSLGNEAALGKDSLPKLAVAVVSMAADGVIDMDTKNKDGDDMAAIIYKRYADAEGKKAIHEHTNGGLKGNASKLRQLINLGLMVTVDAKAVIDDAVKARAEVAKGGEKVKSSYPFMVDVAREQLKGSTPLDMDELRDLSRKDGPKEKTVEGELKRALKILDDLVTGEGKSGLKDQNEYTIAAQEAVASRLAEIVAIRDRVALEQMAAKLGLKIA